MAEKDEEFEYRSPVTIGEADPVSTRDENDYSTLLEVYDEFNLAINGLFKDFNAFNLTNDLPLEVQIKARQVAYDILEPLQSKLESAIADIKAKDEK